MTLVAGSPAVWRSVPDGDVGSVLPVVVVRDDERATVLYQPPGAPCMHRTGAGPRGRAVPAGWDGGHTERPWSGPGVVRIHPRGTHWTVLKGWDELLGWLPGWYVKLEADWARTPIGFDSRDLLLYVVTDDQLSRLRLKGDAELTRARTAGLLGADEADWILALGRRITDVLRGRRWPFAADLSDLAGLRPDPAWPVPQLPVGWRTAGPDVRINPLDALR